MTAPTQVVEVLVHQGSVEEPAIDAVLAPTMDNVITVPLCAELLTCAHLPPLASTSNQLLLTSAGTAAPLLVTGPSFPPIMQGPISMLPGTSIASSGAPRAPVAPQSAGAPHSATLQTIEGMPWSSQPTPYASAFKMAPPMYMPSYMPRPFMQAQFEKLARQHQDIEARELEVQRKSGTLNPNAVWSARVRSATSVREFTHESVRVPSWHPSNPKLEVMYGCFSDCGAPYSQSGLH